MADSDNDSDEARVLRPLQAAAWPCRPRRASGPAPRQAQTVHWTVCVRARPASDPLPRRAGTQRQDARAGGAVTARCAREGRAARRMRGELCAPPPGAAELGAAAQARLRDRYGALPELRRRAEDHRCHPGAAGDREDPHAPGSAGPRAAAGASPWAAAASGLNAPKQSPFKRLRARAEGAGCA